MTQQDDITRRLRDNADLDEAEHGNARLVQLERDAADEIERLRAELSKLSAPVPDKPTADETALRAWADHFPEISDMGRLRDAWNDARACIPAPGWGCAHKNKVANVAAYVWFCRDCNKFIPREPGEPALASAPAALTERERHAITGLISVARAAFNVADDAEDDGDQIKVDRADADALSAALDTLEELPDDQPGYAMGPSNKAEWALRRLLNVASAPVAGQAQPVAWMVYASDTHQLKRIVTEDPGDVAAFGCLKLPLYAAPQASAEDVTHDLVGLVVKLARSIRKSDPAMYGMALDFLKRHNLQGSPLRGESTTPPTGPTQAQCKAAAEIARSFGARHLADVLDPPQADMDGAEQALKDLVTHGVSVQRIAPADFLAGGQQRAGDGKTREALNWYAEQVAGCRKFGPDGEAARHALDRDGGQLARAALSAPQAEQGERDA